MKRALTVLLTILLLPLTAVDSVPLFHRKAHVTVDKDTKHDDTMSRGNDFPSSFASSTDK
ncbi:hypothetical protein [Legionella cherrii]|uniref:Uncharacterized protein n=1 Tax=Legionella cherrii TaxID=28084 RepID=A0ABY6T585_9GAMM|nr:hypothetical protein [Legionella cherrii]VEB35645.1 Uncharacterised protein [Legionella cherrii]